MDQAFEGVRVVLEPGTLVYTDGSAVFPRDIPMRRAAYGVWLGNQHKDNFASALPGKVQTAYRAELHAIVYTAEHFNGTFNIVADCLGVVNEANRIHNGGKASKTGRHADLWHRWEKASNKNIQVDIPIRWVPSHEPRGSTKITESDRVGNNGADELANTQARKVGPSPGQAKHYTNRQNLCTYIQKTQEKYWSKYKHPKPSLETRGKNGCKIFQAAAPSVGKRTCHLRACNPKK
jgi:ribonuclease HI